VRNDNWILGNRDRSCMMYLCMIPLVQFKDVPPGPFSCGISYQDSRVADSPCHGRVPSQSHILRLSPGHLPCSTFDLD
jgi:hypothetical protein